MRRTVAALLAGLCGVLAACSGGGGAAGGGGGGDAAAVLGSQRASGSDKAAAIRALWAEVEAGRADRLETRATLRNLVWKRSAPESARVEAVRVLAADEGEGADADTKSLIWFLLPTETHWGVIAAAGDAAAARGWTDLAGAIIRSYSRPVPAPADADRPEWRALATLFPERPVEETVYAVFASPPGAPDGVTVDGGAHWQERMRHDAWALLSRLDADGSRRLRLLSAEGAADADDQLLALLRRGARELRVVPRTASELDWLVRLNESEDGRVWWRGAAATAANLDDDQVAGLELRHLEPARWAAANRSAWAAASREQLLAELAARLEGRSRRKRSVDKDDSGSATELLRDRESELVWGDVLSILVIDEAMADRAIVESMFGQVEADRADTSTEYGGVLSAAPGSGAVAGFSVRSFPPRGVQRVGDRRFIAPPEMFDESAISLAHYHFHAQRKANGDYAGPGAGDLDYARQHGRNCVVLTSIDGATLNVDYYQPSGARVDLGFVRR